MISEAAAASQSSQSHRTRLRSRAGGDEGERQAKPQAHRQQLLGIERHAEQAPRQVEHPADDAEDQQRLQDVGRERDGRRNGGGLLRRVRLLRLTRSRKAVGLDVVLFVVLQRARVIRDVVLLVGKRAE